MTSEGFESKRREAQDLFTQLEGLNLQPLWRLKTMAGDPETELQPHIWRWREYRPLLERASEVMQLAERQGEESLERRALLLVNPGSKTYSATNTLVAGVQLILPGEVAPAHRHSATAIRLMIEGEGAYTTVQGEKVMMAPGDLILTPGWTWHDHGNESESPIVWLDGLDRVLVRQLGALFMDPHPCGKQELSKPSGYSVGRYGATNVRPIWERPTTSVTGNSPQICYKWQQTKAALQRLADLGETSPFDEVAVMYVNPVTGGHILSTLGCSAQLLRPGTQTKAQRHTGSGVYLVLEGTGSSIINGLELQWEKGDCFVVPPWAWYKLANESENEDAFLFCLNDLPVLQALGLYREQAYEENGGQQRLTPDLDAN